MNELLRNIIYAINGVVGNYGWSIVIFTLLIRLVLTPFDYKSRVGMRRMSAIQPQVTALQKKYANDQEKMNRKIQELYKKERVNPLSSCLPMLITLPLLWIMFAAMRYVANENIVRQVFEILEGKQITLDSWLWVKNLWMPDSPLAAVWPDLNTLRFTNDPIIWTKAFENAGNLPEALALTAESFSKANLTATIENVVNYMRDNVAAYQEMTRGMDGLSNIPILFTSISVMKHYNGFFILPILSAVTQFLMTAIQPQQPQADPSGKQAGTGAFMKWFFPLFSLWICSSYNAIFALYWVASNVIAAIQTFIINKILDGQQAKGGSGKAPAAQEGNLK